MTTLQILQTIRAKVLEATTDLLEDSALLLYINETYKDLIKRTFSNEQITTATVTFTNGIGSKPADFGTMAGDAWDSGNNFYQELNFQDFTKQIQERAVTIQGGFIKVLPTSTASLTIPYYPNYDELTAGSTPQLNSYLHELLIYGGMYRALEDLQDEVLSKYYREKYEAELALKTQTLSNYEEGNQQGGQMFNHQQLL